MLSTIKASFSAAPEVLHYTLWHTRKATREKYRNQHLSTVIPYVHQEAGCQRSCNRPHDSTHHSHSENDQEDSPCVSVLLHVHQSKRKSRKNNPPTRSPTFGHHRIEEPAEKQFFHQRPQRGCNDCQQERIPPVLK